MMKSSSKSIFIAVLIVAIVSITAAQDTAQTTYSIQVFEDASAMWTIQDRMLLETAEDEMTFLNQTAEIMQNQTQLEYFAQRMQGIIQDAENYTGRNMSGANFVITSDMVDTVTGSYGVVSHSFLWGNFTVRDNQTLLIGDVFTTGLYLSEGADLTLIISEGYEVRGVQPPPDITRDDQLTWKGPRELLAQEPNVTLAKRPVEPPFDITPFILPLAAAITIVIIVFLLVYLVPRKILPPIRRVIGDKKRDKRIAGLERQLQELTKTDQERILDLLGEAGGAMYQTQIVKETGFSKSKTSAILSELHKQRYIDKIMKGRRNLIKLK